jgi:hypothetical protein
MIMHKGIKGQFAIEFIACCFAVAYFRIKSFEERWYSKGVQLSIAPFKITEMRMRAGMIKDQRCL